MAENDEPEPENPIDWVIDQETWKLEAFIEGDDDYRLTKKVVKGHSESSVSIFVNCVDLDELFKLLKARRALEDDRG